MVSSVTRVTACACLVLTGLFTGAGAIAQADPDTQGDSGSKSQSANHSPRTSSKPFGSLGGLAGHAGKPTDNSGKKLPGRHSAAVPSTDSSSTDVNSTKIPTANAIANLPDAIPGAATAVQTAESLSGAARQAVQAATTSVPSATGGSLVPLSVPGGAAGAGPLGGVLAPIGNLVENVADALGTSPIIEPFMNVANQLLEGVTVPVSNSVTTRDGRTVHLPAVMPVQPLPERLDGLQPPAVEPSNSLFDINNPAPTRLGADPAMMSPTVMTPQLLSNQVNFSASQPPAVSPATPPVAHDWISGIASQIFHGVREAFRNVTLAELALAALPGAAGLLFFFATGIGLGHRQAKFGFAMATSGSVRFAVRGPLGVVRTGSIVAVHSRKKAAAKETALVDETAETTPKGRRHLRVVDSAA